MFKRFVVGVGKPYSLWLAIALFATAQTAVASDDTVSLRVLGGIGSVSTDYDFAGQEEEGQNITAQIIHFIPEGPFPHAWGLEIGHFAVLSTPAGDLDYDTVSLFVESSPFKSLRWFRANIGTGGYFGDGLSDQKVFGTRVGLGAEIPVNDRFMALGFFRQDVIYDERKTRLFSLQIGVQVRLF